MDSIRELVNTPQEELMKKAKELEAPFELVGEVHNTGKLPVVNFAAGGVATPADAALMMQLGAEGVFVGSGIFKSSNPAVRAKAIVRAVTHYNDPAIIAEVSKDLGEAMSGLDIKQIPPEELLAKRGW
jgi:pyridoxal 5'-phosphate synthase pdxS subunit